MSELETVPDVLAELSNARLLRTQRLRLSIITSLFTKPLAFVIPVVSVPLFIKYLGNTRYGLYESVGALTYWLGLTNLGMTLGLVNRLTDCHVSGDRMTARRYVSSMFFLLLATTLLFSVLWTMFVPLVPWQSIFPTDLLLARRETPWAVWVSGMITLWGLLIGMPLSIYTGYQELHRANLWDGLAKIMTLLACIGVIYTGWGVVGVIIAVAGAALVARLINIVVLFIWEKPWLLPHPRFFDARLLLGTMKQSIGLFILSCASLAIFQVDKLIIAHFLGQDEVAHYSVVGRPFMLVFGVYVMVIGPLWPAHGEALRRGDLFWVRRALQLSSLFGVASVMACGAVMFFFGDQILRVWTRGNLVHASRALVLAMTALFCVWTWLGALSALLNSAGILRAQMWFIGAHAVLNIALALMLVRWYGSTGVAWSISIAGLFTSIWGYPWLLRRHIFSRVPTATS